MVRKKLKKITALFLTSVMLIQTGICSIPAAEMQMEQNQTAEIQKMESQSAKMKPTDVQASGKQASGKQASEDNESTRTMYNLMVFARFKDEDEFIGNEKLAEYTRREIIDNTYNASSYSMKEYYKSVSNEKLNLETVYLYADDDFSSFELDHTRGYYSPVSSSNSEGYEGTGISSGRWYEWLNDWGGKVQNALDNNRQPSLWDGSGNKIPLDKLDSNGDGYIDSISLIYSKAPEGSQYGSSQQDVLWAYQGITGSISINVDGKTLTSHRFSQSTLQFEEQGLYMDAPQNGKAFLTPSMTIHETGHVFGFDDLYYYQDTASMYKPVYYMSPMAKPMSPVTQFMTSYERETQGWLDDNNILNISTNGTYSLEPIKDTRQDGTVCYKIKVPDMDNTWLYMEYRYAGNGDVNRFNADKSHTSIYNLTGENVSGKMIRPSKSGLLVYVVNTRDKYPSNAYKTGNIWDIDVLGGDKSTRSDAPRQTDENVSYQGININVTEMSDDKITFTIDGIKEVQNPTDSETSDVKLTDKLPVCYINTDDKAAVDSKTNYVSGDIKIDIKNGDNTCTTEYEGRTSIKGRGNSTWYAPKKPYKIKLDNAADLFGMGKSKNWVLLANYVDESMMRNTLATQYAKLLNVNAMDSVWVQVVMNDEYIGTYQLCEQVAVENGRVDIFNWENEAKRIVKAIYNVEKNNGMTEENEKNLENEMKQNMSWITSGYVSYSENESNVKYKITDYTNYEQRINGGYLFELDGWYDEESKFQTDDGLAVMVKSPEYLDTNDERFEETKKFWNDIENAWKSEDGYTEITSEITKKIIAACDDKQIEKTQDTENINYSQFIDMDSLVSYWLVNELMKNTDINVGSRYAYLDFDNKLMFGPIWDLDNSAGNRITDNDATGWMTTKFEETQANVPQPAYANFFKELTDDPYFDMLLMQKFWKYKDQIEAFTAEGGWVDQKKTYLSDAAEQNQEYLKEVAGDEYDNPCPRGFDADVDNLKEFLNKRIEWMSQQFADIDIAVNSLANNSSAQPYIKSQNIKMSTKGLNTEADLTEWKVETSDINGNLELIITDDEDIFHMTEVQCYVNGIKYQKEVSFANGQAKILIPYSMFNKEDNAKNMISVIAKDSAGNTYKNYKTAQLKYNPDKEDVTEKETTTVVTKPTEKETTTAEVIKPSKEETTTAEITKPSKEETTTAEITKPSKEETTTAEITKPTKTEQTTTTEATKPTEAEKPTSTTVVATKPTKAETTATTVAAKPTKVEPTVTDTTPIEITKPEQENANGEIIFQNGIWYYYRNGIIDIQYNGMACNEYGWWKIKDGQVDFTYTGMACNENGWWYYRNGQLDWTYTGMAVNENGWWYYRNGNIDWTYTGMAVNEYGWWYYRNGNIDWTYTGMAVNENGWWYYRNGRIDWQYTGLACNEYGWWYYRNGNIDWTYTGHASNEYGVWNVVNGQVIL